MVQNGKIIFSKLQNCAKIRGAKKINHRLPEKKFVSMEIKAITSKNSLSKINI